MRAFIAIELPIGIKDALSKIQDKLKAELPKMEPPGLKPLGEVHRGGPKSWILERPLSIPDLKGKVSGRESISWVKPQNLHLTLKFLGDISPEQLNEIKQIITEIVKTTSSFKIKLETLGVFPNVHAARIIWTGANQPPLELKQLAEQLETRLVESGIPQEQRSFCAHITIGRIKSHLIPSDLKKALDKVEKDVAGVNWEFDCREITLFESTLAPGGPTYTVLEKLNFLI